MHAWFNLKTNCELGFIVGFPFSPLRKAESTLQFHINY